MASSYQMASCANQPCGVPRNQAMGSMAKVNAAFSTYGWEAAKQDGCLPCPGSQLPTWPPQFIYPQQEKRATTVLGENPGAQATTQTAFVQQAKAIIDAPFPNPGAAALLPAGPDCAAAPGAPVLPPSAFDGALATASLLYVDRTAGCAFASTGYQWSRVPACMWNTLQGIVYDLMHWDELPVTRAGDAGAKLAYVFGRDDRPLYLLLDVLAVVLIVAVVRALLGGA